MLVVAREMSDTDSRQRMLANIYKHQQHNNLPPIMVSTPQGRHQLIMNQRTGVLHGALATHA